jgi:thioesterase domain-containing protein
LGSIALGALGLDTRPSELVRRLMRVAGTDPDPGYARPQIIFFPGMLGDDVNTSDFHRLLSQRFAVMAIDPRLGGDALAGDYEAERYFTAAMDAIRRVGSRRRLWLVGYSYGGKLAAETARRLLATGTAVEAVVVLDTAVGASLSLRRLNAAGRARRRGLRERLRSGLADHGGLAFYLLNAVMVRVAPLALRNRAGRAVRAPLEVLLRMGSGETRRLVSRAVIAQIRHRAFGALPAGPLPMALWLLVTDDPCHDPAQTDLGWQNLCEIVHRISVGGTHHTMLSSPTREIVAAELMRLDAALRVKKITVRQTVAEDA